jgi:hypothetical protein
VLAAGASACGGDEGGDEREEPAREPDPRTVDIIGHDLHPEGPPTVIIGQSFTLRGVAPNEPGARAVDLLASPYPHRGWRRIATARGSTSVTFRLRPRINTRYRLRLTRHPRVESEPLKIYVDLSGRLVASLPAAGVTQVDYTGRARSPVTPGAGRVHFYLREDGRGPLRRVATGRPRQGDATSIAVTAQYRDPDPRNGDRFVSCAVGLLAKGFGHPSPSDPDCGDRVMAATKRRLTAPG